MTEEFNLSEKINVHPDFIIEEWIEIFYVKEFIRRLKKEMIKEDNGRIEMLEIIDKLAGDKLT